ncbi:MAG: methyltransferase domain-containing protein [Streptosporangiales bacterium]|nr:methyltransferase domain-containing protein [Streptosporangiales bacterium]
MRLLTKLSHKHRHGHGHAAQEAFEGKGSHRYDRHVGRIFRGTYRRIAADVANLVPSGADVLDISTGPGHLLVELAGIRGDLRVTGVDLSADMVAIARGHLEPFGDRATAVTGDVGALPFDDDSFDVIVSSSALHHWPDLDAAAAEVGRVLRPGGQVLIYDFWRAPFDEMTAATAKVPAFADRPARRTRFSAWPVPGLFYRRQEF